MGYYTQFEGMLRLRPALPDELVQRFSTPEPDVEDPKIPPRERFWWRVSQGEPLPDGSGYVETLIMGPDDEAKFYGFKEWIEVFFDVIAKEAPGRVVTGSIEWDGEEREDLGQITVDADGRARVRKATIVY